MAWSETNGTIVVANIIPSSPKDTYPTHHANFGRGGYKTVNSIEERDAIPVDRLTIGTEVRVTLSDGNSTVYYVSSIPTTASFGKDCIWTPVEAGGLDEEALSSLKGQPNGIAPLDEEAKVPVAHSRAVTFRGYYINESKFVRNKDLQDAHPLVDYGIYIDNDTHFMYSCTAGILHRDTQYWHDI